MKSLIALVLAIALTYPHARAQNIPDTVNGWYFFSVRGGALGETHSQILPGENSLLCQLFHYRTVTPGIQTYITWEKRYESSFATPYRFMIRARIPGAEPSMSYTSARLGFGNDDSVYFPPSRELLGTSGDSVWQDVMVSTQYILTPMINRIRLEFSFDLPPDQPSSGAYEFDSLTAIYTNGSQVLVESFGNAGITTVPVAGKEAPRPFGLDQNFPNPFNPSTNIHYALPHSSFVTLKVYNTLGQQVAQLVNEHQESGDHNVVFHGDQLPSGVYFYQIQAGDFIAIKNLILLK